MTQDLNKRGEQREGSKKLEKKVGFRQLSDHKLELLQKYAYFTFIIKTVLYLINLKLNTY